MKKRILSLITTGFVAATLAPTPAIAATYTVAVKDTAFTPDYVQIDVGDTVTWDVQEEGHTITSEDGLFDFDVRRAEDANFTFEEAGSFDYKCKIHTTMRGRIRVGPVPEPCLDCPSEIRTVPSTEFPTIEDALQTAPPQSLITLQAGSYAVTKTLELKTAGVVIRGVDAEGNPADPATVELVGKSGTETGVRISAASDAFHQAGLENLTVRGFLDSGILVDRARNFKLAHVVATRNVEYGIKTIGATGGSITDSAVSGHRRAGISIEACENCDISVRRVTASNNMVGLQGENAGSLVIRNSTFSTNASGMVLRSVATEEPRIQWGSHIYGNTVTDNNAESGAPVPSVFSATEAMELPVGAGIWIQGGWHDKIEQNVVTGNHYGIVVTGSTTPSIGNSVTGNTTSGNWTDLAWDGLGTGVCFGVNSYATSTPADIDVFYACNRTAQVGIPQPQVDAELAAYAVRNYYCNEIKKELCI